MPLVQSCICEFYKRLYEIALPKGIPFGHTRS